MASWGGVVHQGGGGFEGVTIPAPQKILIMRDGNLVALSSLWAGGQGLTRD